MADSRRRRGGTEEPTATERDGPGGDDEHRREERPRRSEMSRRELRRRRRRAAKAARRGAADASSAPAPETGDDEREDEAPEQDAAVPASDDAPDGVEVGAEPELRVDEGDDHLTVAVPGRRRPRRRRGGDGPVEPLLDPSAGPAHDRTSGEALFDEPGSPPDDEPASVPDDEPASISDDEPAEGDVDEALPDAGDPDDGEPDDEETPVARDVTLSPSMGRRRGRTTRWLVVGIVGIAALAVLGVVAAQFGWIDLARDLVAAPDETAEPTEPPEDGWQPAFLLASFDSAVGQGELRSLAVLATDRRADEGTILLIPVSTITDVPGFGSFTLREAWDLGGAQLVAVTVDNLLGLRIDGVLAVDADGWSTWFEAAGGATIEVPGRIQPAEGTATTGFDPGAQQLGPHDLARYALIRGQGESQLDVLPRTRQLLGVLLDAIDEDPQVLTAVVDAARTFPGTATPDRVETVLSELADARQRDAVTSITMPVIPLGSGEEDLYRSDDERLADVMDDRFAASRAEEVGRERLAVQILNGNGLPGVGQQVAERLADGRYRIVLTGNADRFTYRETRIIVFSQEEEVLRAAQDVQERLGDIGTIERSGTPQSVVDLTIVVGADFPPD